METTKVLSVGQALAEATCLLTRCGVRQARQEAEILLAHATARPRASFYSHPEQALRAEQESYYRELIERRAKGEPIAYLVGEKEFYSLTFWVSRSVLIPRPETEHVVEAAIEALATMRDEGGRTKDSFAPNLCFFDVGTGSGAIAVSVLANVPQARAVASDISPAALEVARRNAERHGVADRLALIEGDMFGDFDGEVDVVVCNPPYVGEDERDILSPEVREYEPHEALFAGQEGLAFIWRLVDEAPRHLPSGGWLIFEIGHSQSQAVRNLLASGGQWTEMEIRNDLAGIPRVAIARKR